jgi:uncharacterized membrane protein
LCHALLFLELKSAFKKKKKKKKGERERERISLTLRVLQSSNQRTSTDAFINGRTAVYHN